MLVGRQQWLAHWQMQYRFEHCQSEMKLLAFQQHLRTRKYCWQRLPTLQYQMRWSQMRMLDRKWLMTLALVYSRTEMS